ncbi:MAG: NADH-quinone oxidoreductase subunit NuoG [Anaerolineales bacterium]|nr:NADH-quinone oxidoreductase subunit NuoG [Anaerolineales bacterium]MDW8162398.1 NADH-quinone oxidoreductase subunit NuoG [Anaerolineales bacterium]
MTNKMITLTIDGIQVTVPEGTNIVDAAKKAGIDIPVFCYHPKMKPVGMCRMCLVEVGRPVVDRNTGEFVRNEDGSLKIQFNPKLETGCTTLVSEGMVVINTSDKVKRGRKDILEFLLTSHPLDCPICDKGGECPLQNLTMAHGPGTSRFLFDEKKHLLKHYPLGELIYLDQERCIQCGRCIRFQEELVDDPVIGFSQRGRSLQIVTFSEPGFDSIFSGNTTDICPVGALTTADFRFGARPWELNAAASICQQCAVGCNLTLNVRREAAAGGKVVIKRVMPRQNEWVNEIWICDKGRFGYHYTEAPERLTQPLIRKEGELVPVSWEEALGFVAERFRQAGKGLLTLASGRLSNEDLFNLRKLSEGLGGKIALYTQMSGGEQVMQVGLAKESNLAELGQGDAILVIASDLHQEAPIWWLRVKQAAERGATLIVAHPRPTRLEKFAKHVLRYRYGDEAGLLLAMLNSLSAKRPALPERVSTLWRDDQVQAAAKAFAEAQNAVIFFGNEGVGLQASQALAQACLNLLLATNHAGRPNNGLIPVWQRPNDQGAWELGWRPLPNLDEAISQANAIYVVACDPAGDNPTLPLTPDFLVVQDLFLTATAKLAHVVLPALPFTEREGSLVNGERRVQRYYPAVPPRPSARADFTITGQLGKLLGIDLEDRLASKVMLRIAAEVPAFSGITYTALAYAPEQWPIIGREDLYYGGTTYENKQGIGVQLPNALQQGEQVTLTWPSLAQATEINGGLLAVPVTKLYDSGSTLVHSKLLDQRRVAAVLWIHPDEAAAHAVQEGDLVHLQFGEASAMATAILDKTVPQGVILLPRSAGIPLLEPCAAQLKVVERSYER